MLSEHDLKEYYDELARKEEEARRKKESIFDWHLRQINAVIKRMGLK
jgi:hypothetical protein